jgi:Clr5 domain
VIYFGHFKKLTMAGVSLKWNGRAPQAPPIPDAEWEKHKAVICHFRPNLTLKQLIDVMATDYVFEAS